MINPVEVLIQSSNTKLPIVDPVLIRYSQLLFHVRPTTEISAAIPLCILPGKVRQFVSGDNNSL